MTPKVADLEVQQGETFTNVVRWEVEPYVYKPITGTIAKAAPVVLPVTAHGLPDGWRVAVGGAQGMTQLNMTGDQFGMPRDFDFHVATVRDANTLELNKLSSVNYGTHTNATGYIQYWSPKDLTGFTARMMIKDRTGGTVLLSLTSADGLFVDVPNKQIVITITPDKTSGVAWRAGVYDLEMVDAQSNVTRILEGKVKLVPEVTA